MPAPTDKRSVAFFSDTYHPQVNGLVTSIDVSRAGLQDLGWRVEVYAPRLGQGADGPGVFRLAGFVYFPQPEYTFVLPWGRGFSLRDLRKRGLSLIHSHAMFGSGLVAALCAWRQRLPLVLTYHTLFQDYAHYFPYLPARLLRWLNRRFTRWMCGRCALVLAPTPAIAQVLKGYGVRTRIEVLPTGMDEAAFRRSGARKADFGAAEGELLLSCAGRLGREKNLELLLEALASADAQLPPWRLLIAGDGPQRASLQRLIRERGLEGKARILGYLPRARVLDLMEASELFAFPSATETQGLVVLESMARGTPVLGVDAQGVGWVMAEGRGPAAVRGGWLARPHDREDFARLLELALGDPAARQAKAREALELAGEYRAEPLARRLGGFYAEVLGGAGGRA